MGEGDSYQISKEGNQPGQKVMLLTACPEKYLQQMNKNRQQQRTFNVISCNGTLILCE
jgi:hypothetical protein